MLTGYAFPTNFPDSCAHRTSHHRILHADIKVREPNLEAMMKGKVKYDPPRFMTVNEAVEQLLETEAKLGAGGAYDASEQTVLPHFAGIRVIWVVAVCGPDSLGIGLARIGLDTQQIVSGNLSELVQVDFGGPLHSFVIVGEMHELEKTMFDRFRVNLETAPKYVKAIKAPEEEREPSFYSN
jgi:diphthine synthase